MRQQSKITFDKLTVIIYFLIISIGFLSIYSSSYNEASSAIISLESVSGKQFLFLILGTTIWGLSPIFYSFLLKVPAIEIVAHRSFWSMVFLFLYLILFSKVSLKIFFNNPREFFLLSVAGILISINWYGFI